MKKDAPILIPVLKQKSENRRYRIIANEAYRESLSWKADEFGKIIKAPKHYISKRCKWLISTLPELQTDPNSPDGLDFFDNIGIDDPYDADKYLLLSLRPDLLERQTVPETLQEQIKRRIAEMREIVMGPVMPKVSSVSM